MRLSNLVWTLTAMTIKHGTLTTLLMGGTIKKIRKKISLTVPKKRGKSHSVEKSGPFCFGMAFYLMLEALDALKTKY